MLKRLIEVALPLKEVSEQSTREKSIRHGHISTLHIWWARRPLAACRAVVFASLIPDPDDPECPKDFRSLVMDLLKHERFRPTSEANGKPVEDTARNRCLEFIKHLVKWENSTNPEFIEPARQLIAAAHNFLHPRADGDAPRVLDPFAGGGAIPLEALRLGCKTYAIDLNPVAHLIELCTLVYPQKYGQPDSRPVPDYIKRLIAHNRTQSNVKAGSTLFEKDGGEKVVSVEQGDIIADVEITEAEYRKNPLAADVKYWGNWVLQRVEQDIRACYPSSHKGRRPTAFLWARTLTCENPTCRGTIPLFRQLWVSNKKGRQIALQMELDSESRVASFSIRQNEALSFDPSQGTAMKGKARCPFCGHVCDGKYLKSESIAGRLGQQLMVVVEPRPDGKGKVYRQPEAADLAAYKDASLRVARMRANQVAALASSVTLVCRRRPESAGIGHWDDIRKELQLIAKERLDFFWSQGIRGADFFISAIGPTLSVFGKYERVTKLSGEEVTVGQFLDEVRGLVTNYALAKILKTTHTANIDPESRFYVIWKWSYAEAKVPADESFKLAQALGIDTEMMWDRTGVLEKSGENVQAVPVAKRMKIKDLGEPNIDDSPASLIDVLHRLCVFRDKGDSGGMAEFLARSRQGKNPALWLVAQAVSEILPDGDKEKQLMQGLLNQREKLEQEKDLLF